MNVAGVLNNDIVGSSTAEDGTKDPYTLRVFTQGPPSTESAAVAAERLTVGGENDSPARELGRYVVETAQNAFTGMKTIAMIYRVDRYPPGRRPGELPRGRIQRRSLYGKQRRFSSSASFVKALCLESMY